MGAGYSTSQDQPPARALHVLRVTPASPASETNIEPFFDFVVGFEGDSFNAGKSIDASELEQIVESHENRALNLVVWNSKNRDTRVVAIIPSRAWAVPTTSVPNPKEPEPESKPSLLGLSMRMCEPEYSLDNVWHVLDVLEGSPAEDAGLVPYGDWIIGWSGGVLSAENDFYEVVESHIDKPLRVYVYSHDFDTIREVVLVPNRQWGGEGLLGCVFGFGLLHRIPAQPADREPGSIPPELREDDEDFEEQTLFVPAEVPVPQPGTPDEHHFTFPQNPGHDWEDVHDGEGHDHHAHDHDHDHGHDHDHAHHSHSPPYEHAHPESVSPAPAQTPPVRPASHTHSVSPGPERSSTPTPGSRPFGSLVNGIGSMNINAGRFGPPPPNLERSLSSGSAMSSSSTFGLVKDPAAAVDEKESESYDDSATSVVGTETSDDETASQGSLTSVD